MILAAVGMPLLSKVADMEQLEFDLYHIPTFRVGCRVNGENQIYEVEAVDHAQAIKFVKDEFPTASSVLATIKGD